MGVASRVVGVGVPGGGLPCSHGPSSTSTSARPISTGTIAANAAARQDEQQQCPDHRPDERHRREPPQGRPVPRQLGR